MEDDLNFIGIWKTTSIILKMEDDLNYLGKWKTTLIFGRQFNLEKKEDNLNIMVNGSGL